MHRTGRRARQGSGWKYALREHEAGAQTQNGDPPQAWPNETEDQPCEHQADDFGNHAVVENPKSDKQQSKADGHREKKLSTRGDG